MLYVSLTHLFAFGCIYDSMNHDSEIWLFPTQIYDSFGLIKNVAVSDYIKSFGFSSVKNWIGNIFNIEFMFISNDSYKAPVKIICLQ